MASTVKMCIRDRLCADLRDGGKDYEGDVEELFQAELYLISPLTEPERFLNKEYFRCV